VPVTDQPKCRAMPAQTPPSIASRLDRSIPCRSISPDSLMARWFLGKAAA
jgi:hypothetical protein